MASTCPLIGDSNGHYRVRVVGNSVAIWLANQINVPYISLDQFYWQPDWKETPRDEFRAQVYAALVNNKGGWVIDGNYTSHVGDLLDKEATDIIWLDPPLLLYLPRICIRTFLRILSRSPPCSPGCQESIGRMFSSDSIVWWCITNHSTMRKRETEKMRELGIHNGGIMRRIGGWGHELWQWKRQVQEVISSQL
ncbi:hypothetical protein PILCRDRAFT_811259 [Piloderma croceum F 1598]|uniref:Uncharacterized protein n=1 Tax=Piloderma croceum (strain F 1598) TaxID=765440 RepID=A0A0C3GJG0_PILCF|nr:hypothetical protein PILCRDRAFT_811259 [Piloderma croceum F 1598]